MNRQEARRLLALSREAKWTYPSSAGAPVGADPGAAIEELLAKRESVVAAARFFLEHGDEDAAVELAANTWRLWMMSRDIAGGRTFLGEVLDGSRGAARARALALYGDGLFAFWQGAQEDSRARNEAALDAARAAGDPEALALAHLGLSRVAVNDHDYERGRGLAVRARELAGELEAAMGQAPLHLHAQATRLAGEYDEAAALFAESLALNRRMGDQGMVEVELHNLGHVEIHRGNVDAAERYFAECAELGADDDPYGEALGLANEAAVAFARGDREGAAERLDRARSLLDENSIELAADDRFEVDWLRERLV